MEAAAVAKGVGDRADAAIGPWERLRDLCDPGSLETIRSGVTAPGLGARAEAGDGVVGAIGRVEGRPVACYAQDAGFMAGSLGVTQAATIERVLGLAEKWRLPVISFVESGGARLQEGAAALCGYGRVFARNVRLSRRVPQISVVCGVSAGGGCYSPALTDFVVMTRDASMFLTGPAVVHEVMGEEIGMEELGGHRVHERNGVCDLVAEDHRDAVGAARSLLGYLPQHAGAELPGVPALAPEDSDPGRCVPSRPRSVYDVRTVVGAVADAGSVLEIAPRWARSIFTGFARIDGRPVGVIANQPRHSGGVLDVDSSQKGARFVEICDRFGLPLVVLVDTPGFMPGASQESLGVIRFGATLVRAFAAATVPRFTVVLRKAYGGAFITMNSKDLGADLVFAWPRAEIGIMGAESAVRIIHRRELAAAADPGAAQGAHADAYAERHLGASAAAAAGIVDEVIEPGQTRPRLASALAMSQSDRGGLGAVSPRPQAGLV
jgi:acetyl-CoA carboxylase carboxyltransferase component